MANLPNPQCIHENVWLVPCFLKRNPDVFVPLFKPFSGLLEFDPQQRNAWSQQEDMLLKDLVVKLEKKWKRVSQVFNQSIYKGIKIRNSKQCRERWINHLNPDLEKSKWTDSEDTYIIEQQLTEGNKWSRISQSLKGRTENAVKNRFKSLFRKAKKLFRYSASPLSDYLKSKKEGVFPEPARILPTSNYPSLSPLGEFPFSSFSDRFLGYNSMHRSPNAHDISPSTMLYFNS